jgi:hypothetical protein
MSIYLVAVFRKYLLQYWPEQCSANSELACIVSGVPLSVGTAERLQRKPKTVPHWHCQTAMTVLPAAHHLVVAACMPEQTK